MSTWRFLLISVFLCPAAQADWFTVAGNAGDDANDYIQTDPSTVKVDGDKRIIDVRVSRASLRTSTDGIKFRSFQGTAEVDCTRGTARYLSSTFFAKPHFAGPPVASLEYSDAEPRPMAFRRISGDFTNRVIRAACIVQNQPRASSAQNSTDKPPPVRN